MSMQGFPKSAQAYIVSLFSLVPWHSLLCRSVSYPATRLDGCRSGLLLAGGASVLSVPVVGFQRPNENSTQNATMSLGLVPTFLLLLAFGPLVGSLAGAMTAMVSTMYPRRSLPVQILFSVSAVVLSVIAASPLLMLVGVAHPGQPFPPVSATGPSGIWQALATLGAGRSTFSSTRPLWRRR
jgi:hypothetical protein